MNFLEQRKIRKGLRILKETNQTHKKKIFFSKNRILTQICDYVQCKSWISVGYIRETHRCTWAAETQNMDGLEISEK
jgi:ribosomal protein L18